MLVVTNIEVKIVPEDIVQVVLQDPLTSYKDPLEVQKEISTTIEQIKGKRFINNQGQTVCIGMSKQVQEAIGLPFEALDNLQKECKFLRDIRNKLENDMNTIHSNFTTFQQKVNNASFSNRLKYLFTKTII
jgi:hypothetical protein